MSGGAPADSAALLEALPIGVAIFDAKLLLTLMTAGYCASLGLPPRSFTAGTPLRDIVRANAHRGLYGPGDPDVLAADVLAMDRSRPGRLRRRAVNGRVFDLHTAPLPDGGHVVCALDTTTLVEARAEAERRATGLVTALASLRIGLGTFSAGEKLLYSNP
ncbi:MAG: PAS-domain containing protein, partial [Acetobacteraceae bacterium]|nr:PAS-domain containing protein [Acetobacteraceae bacterium]